MFYFSCSEMFNYYMIYMLYDYMFFLNVKIWYILIFLLCYFCLRFFFFFNIIWDFKIFFNQNLFLQYYDIKYSFRECFYIFAMLWLVMFGVLMVHQNVGLYVAWCCQINKYYFKIYYYLLLLTSTNFPCIQCILQSIKSVFC